MDSDMRERNRELLAERLGWPDGALGVVRKIEEMYPDYSVYWGTGWSGDPKPGFYARRGENHLQYSASFYGEAAVDLIAVLDADVARRAELAARYQRFRAFY